MDKRTNNFTELLTRCAYTQVYLIGHDLICPNFDLILTSEIRHQSFLSRLNRPDQNIIAITWYPNQMVSDCILAIRAVMDLLWHIGKVCGYSIYSEPTR